VRFRTRLVFASALMTLVTLGLSFWTVAFFFDRGQEQTLDEALVAEARDLAAKAVEPGGALVVRDGPGPTANDVGPLTMFGAVYDGAGALRSQTQTFGGEAPTGAAVPGHHDAFDFWFHGTHLRGVVVDVPASAGARLLIAAPRTDLDGDSAFLARAMRSVLVVAALWSFFVAAWLIRRLTRDQQAIANVVLRVADGDLDLRVRSQSADPDVLQLANSVDTMIERLSQLVASQKRFVAHAAHELRTPLTVVHGQLDLALRRRRTAAEYRVAIREALDSTKYLRRLAEELLILARAGNGKAGVLEPTPIDQVVRDAAGLVDEEAKAASVIVDVSMAKDVVLGRPADLVRMLRNLLENAIRHAPSNSHVVVEAVRDADIVEIGIRDFGPGVPDEDRERVFDPFFRGAIERARDIAGAGLGLPIAREIAHAHGGDIELDPATLPGARFVVRLPRAVAAAEQRG
jgi:two-component system heavy metal sensor histidine kinase CusS